MPVSAPAVLAGATFAGVVGWNALRCLLHDAHLPLRASLTAAAVYIIAESGIGEERDAAARWIRNGLAGLAGLVAPGTLSLARVWRDVVPDPGPERPRSSTGSYVGVDRGPPSASTSSENGEAHPGSEEVSGARSTVVRPEA